MNIEELIIRFKAGDGLVKIALLEDQGNTARHVEDRIRQYLIKVDTSFNLTEARSTFTVQNFPLDVGNVEARNTMLSKLAKEFAMAQDLALKNAWLDTGWPIIMEPRWFSIWYARKVVKLVLKEGPESVEVWSGGKLRKVIIKYHAMARSPHDAR